VPPPHVFPAANNLTLHHSRQIRPQCPLRSQGSRIAASAPSIALGHDLTCTNGQYSSGKNCDLGRFARSMQIRIADVISENRSATDTSHVDQYASK
jgi:hypothetical protein